MKDGSVGSADFDCAIRLPLDGIPTLFVAVVFAAGNACIVGVGHPTASIVSFAVGSEVIDLAVLDGHVAAGPVTL